MSEIDLRYTDKRTVERYMKQGLVDEKAFEKHIKSLPDVAEKGEKLQAEADGSNPADQASRSAATALRTAAIFLESRLSGCLPRR